MKDTFDYEKAKEDAERMLEVIERDPQASVWIKQIQDLVPIFYSLAISNIALSAVSKTLIKNHNT